MRQVEMANLQQLHSHLVLHSPRLEEAVAEAMGTQAQAVQKLQLAVAVEETVADVRCLDHLVALYRVASMVEQVHGDGAVPVVVRERQRRMVAVTPMGTANF